MPKRRSGEGLQQPQVVVAALPQKFGGKHGFVVQIEATRDRGRVCRERRDMRHGGGQTTIGVVVPTLDAQFWNNYVQFMKTGATELGVNLVVLNADNNPDQMIKSLEDLVAQKWMASFSRPIGRRPREG